MGQHTSRRAILGLLGAGTVAVLAACAGGMAQSEVDAVKKQLADEQDKTKTLQQQLGAAEAQRQQAAGTTTLLGAKPVPPAPPKPAPTPLPPGATPPPAPVPPSAWLEPMQVVLRVDTRTSGPGESPFNFDATGVPSSSCVLTSVFKRGMRLVWIFDAIDATTGKRLTDKEVQTALIKLPHGEEIKGRFGMHGNPNNWWWAAAWDIPLDYPMGVLDWSLAVTTKDGKAGTYKPAVVSAPERGIESRTQIVG